MNSFQTVQQHGNEGTLNIGHETCDNCKIRIDAPSEIMIMEVDFLQNNKIVRKVYKLFCSKNCYHIEDKRFEKFMQSNMGDSLVAIIEKWRDDNAE